MTEEYWDLLDAHRRPLERTWRRGLPLEAGAYHVVVMVLTVNARGELLLTLRDANKESHPGKWEVTAGSVLAGERSVEAAVRELREETGIEVNAAALDLLGSRLERSAFIDIYLLRHDAPIESLRMQAGETTAAQWADFDTVQGHVADGTMAAPVVARLRHVEGALLRALA
ncbi:MAG: NUDIX domain-containing protein [Rhodocyclaceae bacterium]